MSLMIVLQPSVGSALVVGGGWVAWRKVRSLVDAGFAVTVVAPSVDESFRQLAGVTVVERAFATGDIDLDPALGIVFACTNDRQVNRRIGEEARKRGILVLVADAPRESTFFSVATHREGDLLIGVSTGGTAPGAARFIKDEIRGRAGQWEATLRSQPRRRPPGASP